MNVFYWSTVDLILWAFITKYFDRIGAGEFYLFSVVLGAVILWNFFNRVQFGFNISFLEDVWTRNFINVFATPISFAEYIMGIILTSVVTAIASLLALILTAWIFFSYDFFILGFYFIPFIFVLFLFGWAIGLFTTSLVLRYGPSAEAFAWSVPYFFTPLSSVFYPVSALPGWLQPFAKAIPSSYVFEGMRGLLLNGVFDMKTFFIGSFLALIYFAGAYAFIFYVYRLVIRKGLFTRFSTD
jgi:ABC-2 type transport system permease protein